MCGKRGERNNGSWSYTSTVKGRREEVEGRTIKQHSLPIMAAREGLLLRDLG
jgi:hypothetical protein